MSVLVLTKRSSVYASGTNVAAYATSVSAVCATCGTDSGYVVVAYLLHVAGISARAVLERAYLALKHGAALRTLGLPHQPCRSNRKEKEKNEKKREKNRTKKWG
eukprot:2900380-Rhodomonas_salina.1